MSAPGPLHPKPTNKWGDDPADVGEVEWSQAGGKPARPAKVLRPRATGYHHATRPDGVAVVFAPGEWLPDWAVQST